MYMSSSCKVSFSGHFSHNIGLVELNGKFEAGKTLTESLGKGWQFVMYMVQYVGFYLSDQSLQEEEGIGGNSVQFLRFYRRPTVTDHEAHDLSGLWGRTTKWDISFSTRGEAAPKKVLWSQKVLFSCGFTSTYHHNINSLICRA